MYLPDIKQNLKQNNTIQKSNRGENESNKLHLYPVYSPRRETRKQIHQNKIIKQRGERELKTTFSDLCILPDM